MGSQIYSNFQYFTYIQNNLPLVTVVSRHFMYSINKSYLFNIFSLFYQSTFTRGNLWPLTHRQKVGVAAVAQLAEVNSSNPVTGKKCIQNMFTEEKTKTKKKRARDGPFKVTFSKASMMMVRRTLMRMKVQDMAKMKNMIAAVDDWA